MIFRRKLERDFTIVPNDLLNDITIGIDSRGLLCYLLSKPEDWEVFDYDLEDVCQCGRDRVKRMLSELKKTGYLRRERVRAGGGKFKYVTAVFDIPQPLPCFPLAAEPSTAEPSTENTVAHIRRQRTDLPRTEKEETLRSVSAPATPDALPAAPSLNGASQNGKMKPKMDKPSAWRGFNDAWLASFNLPETVANLKLASRCKGVLAYHGIPAEEAAQIWGYFWAWAEEVKETKFIRRHNADEYLARFLKDI